MEYLATPKNRMIFSIRALHVLWNQVAVPHFGVIVARKGSIMEGWHTDLRCYSRYWPIELPVNTVLPFRSIPSPRLKLKKFDQQEHVNESVQRIKLACLGLSRVFCTVLIKKYISIIKKKKNKIYYYNIFFVFYFFLFYSIIILYFLWFCVGFVPFFYIQFFF